MSELLQQQVYAIAIGIETPSESVSVQVRRLYDGASPDKTQASWCSSALADA